MKRILTIVLLISFFLNGCASGQGSSISPASTSQPSSQPTVVSASRSGAEAEAPKPNDMTFSAIALTDSVRPAHQTDMNSARLTKVESEAVQPASTNTVPAPPEQTFDPKWIHYRNKVLVLMYHHIDEKESSITISPTKFKEHIQALLDNHYIIIPMARFIHFLNNSADVPPNAVVITFDDGYESFYKYAYPELKSRGLTATNFVVVSYVDKPNPSLPYLTWSELKEMKQYGFSFYSHTYNLHAAVPNEKGINVPPLTTRIYLQNEKRTETEEEYRNRVKADLTLADKILAEKLGNDNALLCFPLGAYNSEVVTLAQEVGIQYLFTIKSGINTKADREINRVHAGMPYITADILIRLLKKYSTG